MVKYDNDGKFCSYKSLVTQLIAANTHVQQENTSEKEAATVAGKGEETGPTKQKSGEQGLQKRFFPRKKKK